MRDIIEKEVRRKLKYIRFSGPDNIGGPCPFHKEGQERRASFYININSGVYYCHTCHATGTFIQFLKRLNTPSTYIDSILEHIGTPLKTFKSPATYIFEHKQHFLNEGLLGVFQYCPIDLVNKGFDSELLYKYEIGFDREYMRITFPIRNLEGRLVGISGRSVIPDAFPRYKVYKSKDILRFASDDPDTITKYESYEIHNHNYLWNSHNVYPNAFMGKLKQVIIVEGYKACLWLIQQGVTNVMALQGSRMTREQELILTSIGGDVILFLDNDKAGKEGTLNTGQKLRKRGVTVYCTNYPNHCNEETQPDNLNKSDLLSVLNTTQNWHQWRSNV